MSKRALGLLMVHGTGVRRAAFWLALLAAGCTNTPREMPSFQELRARSRPAADCNHLVEVVDRNSVTRPYSEVSRLSATCHPSLPEMCERTLRERACLLDADVVLLMPAEPGATPNVPMSRDQVSRSAVLARWR